MYLKVVFPADNEQISRDDYYIQLMLVGEHETYITFKVIRHPCKVIHVKEYAFRNWGANIDRQNVVRKVDNDTLAPTSDDDIVLEGAKYMIIHIPEWCTSTEKVGNKEEL